jgi:stage II sporulation protein AA (anti-sigma F factor antagonist)
MPHVPDALIVERTDGPCPTLVLRGELDLYSAPMLEDALRMVEEEATDRVVLDLGGLTFIDSAGIHRLLASDERLRARGGRLALRTGSSQVQRMLELTGALQRLDTDGHPEE